MKIKINKTNIGSGCYLPELNFLKVKSAYSQLVAIKIASESHEALQIVL